MACVYDVDDNPEDVVNAGAKRDLERFTGINASGSDASDHTESRERRLLELKLLHQWMSETCLTISVLRSPDPLWQLVSDLAPEDDGLLYSLHAFAALHLIQESPNNRQIMEPVYATYLNMAILEHRKAVACLNKANANVICLTSSLLRLSAFANLKERLLDTYSPPTSFLNLVRSSSNAFEAGYRCMGDDKDSLAWRMVKRTPILEHREPLVKCSSEYISRDILLILDQLCEVLVTLLAFWEWYHVPTLSNHDSLRTSPRPMQGSYTV